MDWLKTLFGIDLRSLALFRICLALFMLCEFFLHAFDMHAFHGSSASSPHGHWSNFTSQWFFSVHAINANVFWQALLFFLATIASIGLLVGYRSKLMALLSLALLVSLFNDKRALFDLADLSLIAMCIWALFLPIGARYSVDAALEPRYRDNPNNHAYSPNQPQQHSSIASAGTIIQVLFIGFLMLLSPTVAPSLSLPFGVLVLINLLTVTVPSIAWTWIAARRKPASMDSIIIYYDEDCGFCLKMVLVLRELLLSRYVMVHPAQKYPSVYDIMQRENSWVVQDARGQHHVHWHAMQHLFAHRWPFKLIAWAMLFPPFMALGNKVYRWVANNRGAMSYITAKILPWKAVKVEPSMIGQLIALCVFFAMSIYSVSGILAL